MYAVIRTGGKQYKVSPGDVLAVEKLAGAPGSSVTFSEVLMIGDEAGHTVGAPLVDGAAVTAEVLEQGHGDKIVVFKKKRRKGYRRVAGHRQAVTTLRITDVAGTGGKAAAAPKKAAAAAAETATPAKTSTETPAEPTEAAKTTAQKTPAKTAASKKTAAQSSAQSSGKPAAPKKTTAKKAAAEPDGDQQE